MYNKTFQLSLNRHDFKQNFTLFVSGPKLDSFLKISAWGLSSWFVLKLVLRLVKISICVFFNVPYEFIN